MAVDGTELMRSARPIAEQFAIDGVVTQMSPLGNGLIHRTYRVGCTTSDSVREYVLQQINTNVFREPAALMQNVARVVEHLRGTPRHVAPRPPAVLLDETRDGGQPPSAVPALVEQPPSAAFIPSPNREGGAFHAPSGTEARSLRAPRSNLSLISLRSNASEFSLNLAAPSLGVWRMYDFIPDALPHESPASPNQAFQAAAAFGDFQLRMASLPQPPLHETIPGFHDTPARFDAFERAIARNTKGRAAHITDEIEYLREHRAAASRLIEMQRRGDLPTRVVHNDAKMSNVLLSRSSGDWLCVIDLDTVMPGLAAYDFGDMMRSMAAATREDESDTSRVTARADYCEAMIRGYLSTAAPLLTPIERSTLLDGAIAITLEQAVRFLSDYLEGDTYYTTTRAYQNLDRTRTQIALARQFAVLAPRLRPLCT